MIFNAIKNGNFAEVRILIHTGTNINIRDKQGYTLLHKAAEYNHINIIEFLINQGIDVNTIHKPENLSRFSYWQLLISSTKNIIFTEDIINAMSRLDIWYYLLKLDIIDVISVGETPLHTALYHKNLEAALVLINEGANVNAQEYSLYHTPLHIISGAKYSTILKGDYMNLLNTLISKGADINAKNSDGCTLLHIAVKAKFPEAIFSLLQKSANILEKNNQGKTVMNMYEELKRTKKWESEIIENTLKNTTENALKNIEIIKFYNNIKNNVEAKISYDCLNYFQKVQNDKQFINTITNTYKKINVQDLILKLNNTINYYFFSYNKIFNKEVIPKNETDITGLYDLPPELRIEIASFLKLSDINHGDNRVCNIVCVSCKRSSKRLL